MPFERPQSDLQRSIRTQVQERLDREREQTRFKVSPLRLVLTLAVALIPVLLTFGSADAVLRRVQLLTRIYFSNPPQQTAAPQTPPEESSEPGVVMMMPDPSLAAEPPPANPPSAQAPSPSPEENREGAPQR